LRGPRLLLFVCATLSLLLAAGASAASAPHPFRTAVYLGDELAAGDTAAASLHATGATFVRIRVDWSAVAPHDRSSGFDASDPGDPAYDWSTYDNQVTSATAHGLQPYLTVLKAPLWAQAAPPAQGDASNSPSASDLREFATAVARRYSGAFNGLPRVRYFQVWNEPNLSLYLVPQLVNGKPVAPGVYRGMLNAFADAVHAVHRDNVVIVGGLAPFRDVTPSVVAQNSDWGPLAFMRELLCLSPSLKPTCSTPAKFDVWAQHPYTSGDARHRAALPNDVSLGDLPKVRRVLAAAIAAGHVVSVGRVGFWVTEFSWDSNPPDPQGVPMALETRWVAEAFHQMWLNDVTLVTWLMLTDAPLASSYFQSGLYYLNGKPKPLLRAFRFPFVAYRDGSGISFWGRTPAGASGKLVLEQRIRGRWAPARSLRSDRYGIFAGTLPLSAATAVRARIGSRGETSPPFSLARFPDRRVSPFGKPTLGK
jgi:hypothetical protein